MLILLRSKLRPIRINKAIFIVMFNFMLVPLEIFECCDHSIILYPWNVVRLPIKLLYLFY